ncbi:MAG: hypothetical protein ABI718_03445 [Acidobacteriota bacterium]
MRLIGFSSGALAKGDFRRGLDLQRASSGINAVELSALREGELQPLVSSAASLDVSRFQYVSFHAPSALRSMGEREVVQLLTQLPGSWPLVVHPDLIADASIWRPLGSRLCLENMDLRKATGRTVSELSSSFEDLPDAGFCLDLGHARQVDPTMSVAIEMLHQFGDRLRQLHVGEVGTFGDHRRIGFLSRTAFRKVVRYVPDDVPLILESIVSEQEMEDELETVREIFAA